MIAKEKIRQYLLTSFEGFVDSSNLTEYLEFIEACQSNKTGLMEYSEKHHIIPVSCYKIRYACKDRYEALRYANSDPFNTLLSLSYKDHCKAHYLLYFCTEGQLQKLMATPLDKLLKVIKPTETGYIRCLRNKQISLMLTDDDFELLQQYKNQMYNNENSKYWTPYEDAIIKQYYSRGSLKLLHEYLPHRSIEAIRDHATKRLNLHTDYEWTDEELDILHTYYKAEGRNIVNRLPKRNWRAITTQACLLGIHTKNYWTEPEIQILIEFYPKEAGKVQIRLPNHSITNIYSKVKELKQKGLL